jgi:RNA polymerase sigma-70 factor (ECF subfamily)
MLETRLKALMIAGLAGDGRAQEALLSGCANRLRQYYARRLPGREADVEDLVQDTLMVIHKRRESYDHALPFTAWLHAIARYKLIDFFRRCRVRETLPIDDVADFSIDDEGTATMARIDIERLLAALPAKHAEAIRLTRIDGLSVKEAAAQSGQSEPSIKVGVYRGLHRLMNALQGKAK